MSERSYDLVLYGATGFTGRQAAHYLAAHTDVQGLRWAIAGRDANRLEQLRKNLGEQAGPVGIIVADSQDHEALTHLAAATHVVISTAGPFTKHGEGLVQACLAAGTDYADITGETPWVRSLIDRFHDQATAKGVRIVPFCGFDSIPSDLGALLVVDYIRQEYGQGTRRVKGYFNAFGGFNGGTLASLFDMIDAGQMDVLNDPLLLNPPEARSEAEAKRNPDQVFPELDMDFKVWTSPFFMAPVNTRVVRRSHALASSYQQPYGPDFRYSECMYFDELVPLQSVTVSAATGLINTVAQLPGFTKWMRPLAPSPGKGPSQALMDAGYFKCWLVGEAEDGTRVKALVAEQGDPGNRATVKMLCEAGLALVLQKHRLPGGPQRGGVLTPATALGMVLVDRLRNQGMRWEIKGTF